MSNGDMLDGLNYSIYPDKETKWNSEQALQLMDALLSGFGRVALMISAFDTGVRLHVLDLSGYSGPPKKELIKSVYPTSVVQAEHAFYYPMTFPYRWVFSPVHTWSTAENPILYVDDIHKDADPLSAFYHLQNGLGMHEQVTFTIFVSKVNKPLFHLGTQIYKAFKRDQAMRDYKTYQRSPTAYEKVIESKREDVWFECYMAYEVYAADLQRGITISQNVAATMLHFRRDFPNHPHNGLAIQDKGIASEEIRSKEEAMTYSFLNLLYNAMSGDRDAQRNIQQYRSFLSARELAALWHVPHEGFQAQNVAWKPSRPEISKELAANDEGVLLGAGIYEGDAVGVYLPDADRRTHINIVGRTGTGKSTFLANLIRQDIRDGKGVAVIDPHGDLVRAILQTGIPKEREGEVLVFDLADPRYPIPLNLFAGTQTYGSVGRVVDILERMYVGGVRTDRYLRAGVQAVQQLENATMRDLQRLFVDGEFRTSVLENTEDDDVFHTLHDDYHVLSPGKQREIRDPIIHRIDPFYRNTHLYPSLCHPKRLDFDSLMAERKIVLISLGVNEELVPEKERHMVGALLISLIQMVGMKPERERTPYYVYIDEVQDFVTTSLAVIFSEARKYGISMTVANQFLDQFTRPTLQAIMSNVGMTVTFRSNADDARDLRSYLQPQFDAESLLNLDMYQAAVKLQFQGKTQGAFWLHTMPPPEMPNDALQREAYLRTQSMKRHGMLSREEVLAWLEQRYPKQRRVIGSAPTDDDDDQLQHYDP